MINKDFSNVMLTKCEKRLLIKAQRRKVFTYSDDYQELIRIGFVDYCNYTSDEIGHQLPVRDKLKITESGTAFLKTSHREVFRFYFPIIISVIALIFSLLDLLLK